MGMKHAALFSALLLAPACGGGGEPIPDTVDAAWDCEADMRDEMFVAGMQKVADSGTVFTLMDSQPAPPNKGYNDWTLQITDADGNPVDVNATASFTQVCDGSGDPLCENDLIIKPKMPDHGHGSSIIPEVKETGDAGVYQIQKVNLYMSGYWEIAVGAKGHGEVMFKFCI